MEDALVIDGIFNKSHSDPRKAVADLLAWESDVATDPAVSTAAIALQYQVAEACAKYVNRFISGDGILNDVWVHEIEEGIRAGKWRDYL